MRLTRAISGNASCSILWTWATKTPNWAEVPKCSSSTIFRTGRTAKISKILIRIPSVITRNLRLNRLPSSRRTISPLKKPFKRKVTIKGSSNKSRFTRKVKTKIKFTRKLKTKIKFTRKVKIKHFMKRTNNFMKRIKIKHFMKRKKSSLTKSPRILRSTTPGTSISHKKNTSPKISTSLRTKSSSTTICSILWTIMMQVPSWLTLTSSTVTSRTKREFICSSEVLLRGTRSQRSSRTLIRSFLRAITTLRTSTRSLMSW